MYVWLKIKYFFCKILYKCGHLPFLMYTKTILLFYFFSLGSIRAKIATIKKYKCHIVNHAALYGSHVCLMMWCCWMVNLISLSLYFCSYIIWSFEKMNFFFRGQFSISQLSSPTLYFPQINTILYTVRISLLDFKVFLFVFLQ